MTQPRRRGRAHYWLLLIPFVWQLALAPYVNRIVIRGCPIPFPMLWQMVGIVWASAALAVVYRIDRRDGGAPVEVPPETFGP
jgi:Protein of unknown function (DUF3311)